MDLAALVISLLALSFTTLTYLRARRKTKNQFVRLIILTKSIRRDLESIHFNHGLIHFIPGEKYNESAEESFNEKMHTVRLKIEKFYELLILDKKISSGDLLQLFECLTIIEDNLFELFHYTIENMEDLEVTKSMINPIGMQMEIIEKIIEEYNN